MPLSPPPTRNAISDQPISTTGNPSDVKPHQGLASLPYTKWFNELWSAVVALQGGSGSGGTSSLEALIYSALAQIPVPSQRVVNTLNGKTGDLAVPLVDAMLQAAAAEIPIPSQRSIITSQSDMTASRSIGIGALGTVYRNEGAQPIFVNVVLQTLIGTMNGAVALTDYNATPVAVVTADNFVSVIGDFLTLTFIVLPGAYYGCWAQGSTALSAWIEYR